MNPLNRSFTVLFFILAFMASLDHAVLLFTSGKTNTTKTISIDTPIYEFG